MKSIKQQFIDLKEGRMSQQNFMRNLRMAMPHYVTNVTSFGDAVKILRNKGILNEALIEGNLDVDQEELKKGIKVEMEHTKDRIKAEEIALDHLQEDPKYYTKLDKAGLEENDGDDDEIQAMIDKYEKEKKGEEAVMSQYDENLNEAKAKWENANGKSMYAQFKEIDNLNGQEVLIGIDLEMEKDEDLSKIEAAKIVLKNLKKNPIYYTAMLLAGGKEMTEIPTIGKLKPGSDKMKEVKGEDSLVDKDNGMKPVKDIEKVKASSNKASKETNKPEKGISLMSLVAKASRGVQKMNATGEKMKVVKEDLERDFDPEIEGKPSSAYMQFLAQKKGEEAAAEIHNGLKRGDKVKVNSEAAKALKINPNETFTITSFKTNRPGSLLQSIDVELANKVGQSVGYVNVEYVYEAGSETPKVDNGSVPSTIFSRNAGISQKLKSLSKDDLMEIIREELSEYFDGRDNLTDTAGHQNEGIVSGALAKVKDKIVNSSLFKKLIDTIVSKMSDKDIAAFKAKFNISEAEGGPSLEDIMSKVDAINPDKTAKTPEDLKEALDEDTLEGKIAGLVRSIAGINLLALGGAPLGIFINSLLGIATWGFGAFIGPVISLVASLIIHGISSRLLGKTGDDELV